MMLGSLGHRTPSDGRCYGQTGPTGRRLAAAGAVAAGAHYPRLVSGGVWARAPHRAAAGVDADRAGAVLGGRHSAGPQGVEPSLGRRARAARTALPARVGDPGGLLSALPGPAARIFCRGVRAFYGPGPARRPAAR